MDARSQRCATSGAPSQANFAALDLGKPPELDGRLCAKCGTRFRVQDDHREALANGGLTSRDNLGHLCDPDHKDKTQQDRQERLFGGGDGRDPP